MQILPADIIDSGYMDLTKYEFIRSVLTGADLQIFFAEHNNDKKGFIIQLQNIVAFTDDIKNKKILMMRIDSDGGTYGIDMALKLKNKEYAKYMLLYLFEDIKHTAILFRGLAKNITVQNYTS
jgi:hypothetical protein